MFIVYTNSLKFNIPMTIDLQKILHESTNKLPNDTKQLIHSLRIQFDRKIKPFLIIRGVIKKFVNCIYKIKTP